MTGREWGQESCSGAREGAGQGKGGEYLLGRKEENKAGGRGEASVRYRSLFFVLKVSQVGGRGLHDSTCVLHM